MKKFILMMRIFLFSNSNFQKEITDIISRFCDLFLFCKYKAYTTSTVFIPHSRAFLARCSISCWSGTG